MIFHPRRLKFVLAVVTALATPAHAASTKAARLDMLAECPPGAACITAEVTIPDIEKRTLDRLPQAVDPCEGQILMVRGRLNAGRIAHYRVAFRGACTEITGDAYMPYVGQSGAGNSTALTNKGRLEIIDKTLTVGAPRNLVVADITTAKVVGTYWGDSDGNSEFFFSKGRFYLQDGDDGACLEAPRSPPRSFVVAPKEMCADERALHNLAGEEEEPPPAVVKAFMRLQPPESKYLMWGGGESLRIKGTNLWVRVYGERVT